MGSLVQDASNGANWEQTPDFLKPEADSLFDMHFPSVSPILPQEPLSAEKLHAVCRQSIDSVSLLDRESGCRLGSPRQLSAGNLGKRPDMSDLRATGQSPLRLSKADGLPAHAMLSHSHRLAERSCTVDGAAGSNSCSSSMSEWSVKSVPEGRAGNISHAGHSQEPRLSVRDRAKAYAANLAQRNIIKLSSTAKSSESIASPNTPRQAGSNKDASSQLTGSCPSPAAWQQLLLRNSPESMHSRRYSSNEASRFQSPAGSAKSSRANTPRATHSGRLSENRSSTNKLTGSLAQGATSGRFNPANANSPKPGKLPTRENSNQLSSPNTKAVAHADTREDALLVEASPVSPKSHTSKEDCCLQQLSASPTISSRRLPSPSKRQQNVQSTQQLTLAQSHDDLQTQWQDHAAPASTGPAQEQYLAESSGSTTGITQLHTDAPAINPSSDTFMQAINMLLPNASQHAIINQACQDNRLASSLDDAVLLESDPDILAHLPQSTLQRYESFTKDLQRLEQENEQLRKDNAQLRAYTQELEQQQETSRKLQSENSRLAAENRHGVQQLLQENTELKEIRIRLEADKQAMNQQIKVLMLQVAQLQKAQQKLEHEQKERTKHEDLLESMVLELEQQFTDIRKQIATSQANWQSKVQKANALAKQSDAKLAGMLKAHAKETEALHMMLKKHAQDNQTLRLRLAAR